MEDVFEDTRALLAGLGADVEVEVEVEVERARGELQRLMVALRKSRERRKELEFECRQLKAEMVCASCKAAAALHLSLGDDAAALEKELNEVQRMEEAAQDKDKRDKETLRVLQDEVADLLKTTQQQSGLLVDHEQRDLLQLSEELSQERDQLLVAVETLREKLQQTITHQQQLEGQRWTASDVISQIHQRLEAQQDEINQRSQVKEKLVKERNHRRAELEAKTLDCKAATLQHNKAKEEQQRVEQQLRELKMVKDQVTKELEQTRTKSSRLHRDCEQLSAVSERLSAEHQHTVDQLKSAEEDVSQLRQEIANIPKLREAIQKKCHQMQEQKADMDAERETLRARTAHQEEELEISRKQEEDDKKAIDKLIRERSSLRKTMLKASQSTEKQQKLLKLLEQDRRILEHTMGGYQQEVEEQRSLIQQLERERDALIGHTGVLLQKVQQNMCVAEEKEGEVLSWRKKLCEAEHGLRLQENQLEGVTAERNTYSRTLIHNQEEMAEMRRRIRTMDKQMVLLKQLIARKELDLTKNEEGHKHIESMNEALQRKVAVMQQQLEESKQRADTQRAELQKLQRIVAAGDAEQIQQKKQLEQVLRELENLTQQLLRCNSEGALLCEKTRIQQSTLDQCDLQYEQRREDLRLLKLELNRLQRKKAVLDKMAPRTPVLRKEVLYLQKKLRNESIMNSVLEEQLKPINIHRWRQLEDTDPEKCRIIHKFQALQKQLIIKTQNVEEVQLSLQEKEKAYMELKQHLSRQPGPEAAEQLQQCQWALKERTEKLKTLAAELRMTDAKMEEYRRENETLDSELADVKKQCLGQR